MSHIKVAVILGAVAVAASVACITTASNRHHVPLLPPYADTLHKCWADAQRFGGVCEVEFGEVYRWRF